MGPDWQSFSSVELSRIRRSEHSCNRIQLVQKYWKLVKTRRAVELGHKSVQSTRSDSAQLVELSRIGCSEPGLN